jgi:hypothetical protein
VHTSRHLRQLRAASPLPKGMEAPQLFNQTRLIDINSIALEELDAPHHRPAA